ncbi:MAG: type IV toxin-antitoxin system AbiEi family antitoxin domain-containing protein [Nitrososphaerota archaeon]|nr:type IV toxin-antitoxin system AbiEi family antitoxin domain-containing protein [Nitrososphaerota archaeon]
MGNQTSLKEYRHSLSDRESKILSNLSYEGKSVFTVNDIKRFVKDPENILDSLRRKKWLLKIKRGVYAIAPLEAGEKGSEAYALHSFSIGSFLVEPYYIAYWSALNHYGLTDQTPPAVYIATTKPRNSRRILNTQFKFVTIPKRKLFAVEKVEIEKRKINISSREKTIADCLDHPEHAGGVEEVAKAIYFASRNAEIDFNRLVDCSRRLGNSAVLKRLGYIAETLNIKDLSRLLSASKLASGYSVFDPALPKKGRIRERWKLLVNASIDPEKWSA